MSRPDAPMQALAVRYRQAPKSTKVAILDELCATTGWHRDHARKVLRQAWAPRPVAEPRKRRSPTYGEDVVAALRTVWTVMNAPSGKRLAPFLPEITDRLRASGELDITDELAALLCSMSPATIDRKLAADRRRLHLDGRSSTKPGTLVQAQVRAWPGADEGAPGCVAIDWVHHDGGALSGDFYVTLAVTDIRTGWTGMKAVGRKLQEDIHAALGGICDKFPFEVHGMGNGNENEFNNVRLLPSRGARGRDSWSDVRRVVGFQRYDTEEELLVLNELYGVLAMQINFFCPRQQLLDKRRVGARVTRRYDTAATPYQRVLADGCVTDEAKEALSQRYRTLNPAQVWRDLRSLQDRLRVLASAEPPPVSAAARAR